MNLIKKFVRFFARRLFVLDKVILFKMDQANEVNSPVILKKADINNINDILNFQNKKYLILFKKFLKEGGVGYLGYLDDRCIHRSWVVVEEGSLINLHPLVKRKLDRNAVYIHYCETAPAARGKGVYPYVISTIAKDFQNKTVLICVNNKNIPSIKGVKKAGFKPVESVTVIALLGIVIRMQKDLKGVEV
ncbi:N-acetyltransferase [Pseudobacillus wudalianchiensis]|uniref:N-acetyltransferase domain-containing protein n=1 Tax=Pseudobacillus wudalianchiensis TaxID=1743143 RepID=A0A1B9AYF2_9BACI|nr:N-acetyltransferase [Bacillus wudalianchiensis]OCA88919.1 hypothetical protein A8F95_05705 [Bacillus wudalianchiensis]